MQNDLPAENIEAVALSEVISHPRFNSALRAIVIAMAEHPGSLSLDEVVAALGMNPQTVAERFVAEAIGSEFLRIREADATKAKGLH